MPVTFIVFDLLHLDRQDVTRQPLKRRRALDALGVSGRRGHRVPATTY
jgi:ATP-dependent DNA ligase